MARITVEDCLENVPNRFDLVMIASKRARQIQTGGKSPMISEDKDKPAVLALREVAANLVSYDILNEIEFKDDTAQIEKEADVIQREEAELSDAMDATGIADQDAIDAELREVMGQMVAEDETSDVHSANSSVIDPE
jgi:DNA-directed RNA polymerase subunit omega